MKNGTPIIAVKAPNGVSCGALMSREAKSATNKNHPPNKAEMGIMN